MESNDQVNELYCRFYKAVELAEATSNRNAGKELGINEKLVQDGGRKRWSKVKLPRAMQLILR